MSCASSSSDDQKIEESTPTIYHLEKSKVSTNDEVANSSSQTTSAGTLTVNFLINRDKLRKNGGNISVDSALELLLSKVSLGSNPYTAYQFVGYDLVDDGLAYIISYGTYNNHTFKEERRFAISYNKTIYEASLPITDEENVLYSEIYSIGHSSTTGGMVISAYISDKTLYIKDNSKNKIITKQNLAQYNLETAEDKDIILLDMNFDGYMDVAISAPCNEVHFTYHAFLYNSKEKEFEYNQAYANLISPEYHTDNQTIHCSQTGAHELVYDTYSIVSNAPEIKERLCYTYEKNSDSWKMEHFSGEHGKLTLVESKYYTSSQVSELTGEFVG